MFGKNMVNNTKLNKAQFFNIIQSGLFLDVLLKKFAGLLMKFVFLFGKIVLAPLATMAFDSAINAVVPGKMFGIDVETAGEEITLLILNKDMDEIIRIIKSLENFDILVDRFTKLVDFFAGY